MKFLFLLVICALVCLTGCDQTKPREDGQSMGWNFCDDRWQYYDKEEKIRWHILPSYPETFREMQEYAAIPAEHQTFWHTYVGIYSDGYDFVGRAAAWERWDELGLSHTEAQPQYRIFACQYREGTLYRIRADLDEPLSEEASKVGELAAVLQELICSLRRTGQYLQID